MELIDGTISWIGSYLITQRDGLMRSWRDPSLTSRALLKPCHVLNIFINNVGGNLESMLARFKGIIKMNAMDPES